MSVACLKSFNTESTEDHRGLFVGTVHSTERTEMAVASDARRLTEKLSCGVGPVGERVSGGNEDRLSDFGG